jgi:hypothetical protein
MVLVVLGLGGLGWWWRGFSISEKTVEVFSPKFGNSNCLTVKLIPVLGLYPVLASTLDRGESKFAPVVYVTLSLPLVLLCTALP